MLAVASVLGKNILLLLLLLYGSTAVLLLLLLTLTTEEVIAKDVYDKIKKKSFFGNFSFDIQSKFTYLKYEKLSSKDDEP